MTITTVVQVLRLLLIVGLLALTADSKTVIAHRRRHKVTNIHTILERQSFPNDIYPVLGVAGLGVNVTQPRLEIRELQRNPDLFNIYLLALQRWQSTNQDDKLSYFQVAGAFSSLVVPLHL
jgi:tyrosinase